jgi:hypothetical protein
VRLHRKIWLWFGERPFPWAVQLYANRYVSLGFHFDWQRPLLDLHIGWFIVAIGRDPTVTSRLDRFRESCRGFEIDGTEAESAQSPLYL